MPGRPYFRLSSAELVALIEVSQEDGDILAAIADELSHRKTGAAVRLSRLVDTRLAEIGRPAAATHTSETAPKKEQHTGEPPRSATQRDAVIESGTSQSRVPPPKEHRASNLSAVSPTAATAELPPRGGVQWIDPVPVPPASERLDVIIRPWMPGRLLGRPNTLLEHRASSVQITHPKSQETLSIAAIKSVEVKSGLFSSTLIVCETDGTARAHRFGNLARNSRDRVLLWFAECRFGDAVRAAILEFNALLEQEGYLTHRQLGGWARRYGPVLQAGSELLTATGEKSAFVGAWLELANTWRKRGVDRNDRYVAKMADAYRPFFDKLESNPLTDRQVEAILRDDDHTLVAAGAGTGKTSTVVGKVGFLVAGSGIAASEILALAFGRDAAAELRDRVATRTGLEIEVRTFHSLGLKIAGTWSSERQHVADTATDEKAFHALLARLISELLVDQSTRNLVVDFVVTHRYPAKYLEDFDHNGDYLVYLRKQEPRTLRGELVNSFEELLIADWLMLNGVRYEYEHPYEHKTANRKKRQYKPDFYLLDYGIYLEHFGLGRNGDTAPGIDKDLYHEGIEWKRNLHKTHGTVMVETYSWERMTGILLPSLEEKLRQQGVRISPMDEDQVDALIRQREVHEPLVALLQRFLTIYREGMWSEAEVREGAINFDDSARQRAESFLGLFLALENRYRGRLAARQEIDFSDMISRSVQLLDEGKVKCPFRRIIVDEYQDISRGRHRLLLELLKQTDDTRILCVGDDWQSIYGFTGSDIRMTTEFETRFGSCVRVDLDESFRFSQSQLNASSWFIQKNENQLKKAISARARDLERPVEVLSLSSSAPDYFTSILEHIDAERPPRKKWSVILLGRYNRLAPDNLDDLAGRFAMLDVKFMTIHKAKGLEADAVAVLDLRAARYGFPSEVEDDPLLGLVLPANESFVHAEERRVLYVAMTRARSKTLLVADPHSTSEFVEELLAHPDVHCADDIVVGRYTCPSCKRGRLELTNPNRRMGYAWRCTLRPYCDYEAKYCTECMGAPALGAGQRSECMSVECRSRQHRSASH